MMAPGSQEVTDPNAVRADAQDAESSDARDGAGRPLRYTHPNSRLGGEHLFFFFRVLVVKDKKTMGNSSGMDDEWILNG